MLLLIDEHMTHIFYPCNSAGITRYIHLLKFPPHVIDILQSLDECCLDHSSASGKINQMQELMNLVLQKRLTNQNL